MLSDNNRCLPHHVSNMRSPGATKNDTFCLCRSKGLLGPPTDHIPFMLSNSRQNMNGQSGGIGVVAGHEIDASIHKVGNEGNIT